MPSEPYLVLWVVSRRMASSAVVTGYVQDCGELVLRLHLPDCGRHHSPFLLPVSHGLPYQQKGAGRPIEFKGLKSQYLFFLPEGLVSVFLAVVVLYMAGVSQLVCLSFGAVSGTLAVWLTFRMNARYGEHGLMKMLAEKRHPRYLSARRRIFRALTKKKRKK